MASVDGELVSVKRENEMLHRRIRDLERSISFCGKR